MNCIKNLETQVEALQAKVAKAQDLQKEQESVQVRLVSVRADLEQDLKETKEELEEVIKKKTDDIESNVNFRLNQLKLDEVIQYKYICLYNYLRTYECEFACVSPLHTPPKLKTHLLACMQVRPFRTNFPAKTDKSHVHAHACRSARKRQRSARTQRSSRASATSSLKTSI
mgnify:CR=1 FL=1